MSTIHVKPKPWIRILADMEIEEQQSFSKLNLASIKSMISGPIKREHPNHLYTTRCKGDKLTVTRIS